MPIIQKHHLSEAEQDAAIVLYDTLLFAQLFWADDLTVPHDRVDLKEYVGKQVISREQRIMFLAGCEYMLLRDAMPDVLRWSPRRLALRTSRKIAKTVGFEVRWVQIPLAFKTRPGMMEGFIHTPGDPHLMPVMERVQARINATPLFREMVESFNITAGIQVWKNGWRWQIRVEGMGKSVEQAGRSQVGVRAHAMLGDEADFSLEAMWDQREQSAMPTAYIYEGGVPRGWRGKFWKVCNTELAGWFVFRADMRANILFHSPRAWNEQVQGNYRSQRVQTQVLGMDGEEAVASFPVVPVDMTQPYVQRTVTLSEFEQYRYNLSAVFELPHAAMKAEAYALAMDYGFSPSPSELFVLGRENNYWRVWARYELLKCDTYPTAEIIRFIDTVLLHKLADVIIIDAHGQGAGVLSALHNTEAWSTLRYQERARNANFAGQVRDPSQQLHTKCRQIVTPLPGGGWRCNHCNITLYSRDELTERPIPTKTWLLSRLKEAFMHGQRVLDDSLHRWAGADALILGWDEPLITELSGATEVALTNSIRIITASGQDHMLDGILASIAAISQWADSKRQTQTASLEEFGWVKGVGGDSGWKAPWLGG